MSQNDIYKTNFILILMRSVYYSVPLKINQHRRFSKHYNEPNL